MNQTILEFLRKHRISVLGVGTPEGGIHLATLHYAHSEKPLAFVFITEKKSRKCYGLLDLKSHPASLVIGFSEEEFVTFQMEGEVKIVSRKPELEKAWETYLTKFPQSIKRKTDKDFVILEFKSNRWSYRDFKTSPRTVITSED